MESAAVDAESSANAQQQQQTTTMQNEERRSAFRSEPMRLCQIILPKEAAYRAVGEMGKLACVQIIDLNPSLSIFQREFVRQVRRCDDLERSLRFLEQQVYECVPNIALRPIDSAQLDVPDEKTINDLETVLLETERQMRQLNDSDSVLRRQRNQMREYQHVLRKVEQFFEVHHLEDEAAEEIAAAEVEAASIDGVSQIVSADPTGTMMSPSPPGAVSLPLLRAPSSGLTGGARSPSASRRLNPNASPPASPNAPGASGGDPRIINPWFLAGVMPTEKAVAFERVLWRACRRTAFVRTADIPEPFQDPDTGIETHQCVFIVFYKGDSLRLIIEKVCSGFGARIYPSCPKASRERQMEMVEYASRSADLDTVIESTAEHRHRVLSGLADKLPDWLRDVQLHKAVYHALNQFTFDTSGFFSTQCWVPESEVRTLKVALDRGVTAAGLDVRPIVNVLETAPNQQPPTFHRTNKFTHVFQSIVDSYGVATYQEINPAPFTVITFPALFSLMFADAAHGLIMALGALFLILNEQKIIKQRVRNEIFGQFFGGRYIILLMGLFSIYAGALYNDAFAKSAAIFDSKWKNVYSTAELGQWMAEERRAHRHIHLMLDPVTAYNSTDGPYPFGVDPVWNIADNRLSFLNSMKMKSAVIIGVAQMTFGVILSFLNYRFFRSTVDIFTVFLPQLVFLASIFIYLCVQIFAKWTHFSAHPGQVFGREYPGPHCAPSLLVGLINMFMMKSRNDGFYVHGLNDETGRVERYTPDTCYLATWYPNQAKIEQGLLAVALLCIPIMLFGKVLHFALCRRQKRGGTPKDEAAKSLLEKPNGENAGRGQGGNAEEHQSLSDLMVHQGIHTVEFVLGCVSHTASYLRLWALSLAHAQLSEVLWHMVLIKGLNAVDSSGGSPLGLLISGTMAALIFFIFGVMTVSVLVLMEGLSAFLHALRLHWVEFMSKFYSGAGQPFTAFSLREALEQAQHLSDVVESGLGTAADDDAGRMTDDATAGGGGGGGGGAPNGGAPTAVAIQMTSVKG